MENEAWRDHFGSVHGGPVLRQRKDKKTTKEDKRTGRQTGGGDGWGKHYGAGTSPAGALAHLPCCHTKGDTIRVGLKDGGGKGEGHVFFFGFCFFFLGVVCCRPPWPDMGDPMCGGWENGRSIKEKVKRGGIVSKSDGPKGAARSSASLWGEGKQGRLRRKGAYSRRP